MKKFLALALAMAMMLTLAACGGGSTSTPSSTPADDTPANPADTFKVGAIYINSKNDTAGYKSFICINTFFTVQCTVDT